MQLRRIDRDIKKVKGGQHTLNSTTGGRTHLQRASATLALANTGGGQPLSVTDEKFCIFFHFEIDVGENRLVVSFVETLIILILTRQIFGIINFMLSADLCSFSSSGRDNSWLSRANWLGDNNLGQLLLCGESNPVHSPRSNWLEPTWRNAHLHFC